MFLLLNAYAVQHVEAMHDVRTKKAQMRHCLTPFQDTLIKPLKVGKPIVTIIHLRAFTMLLLHQ